MFLDEKELIELTGYKRGKDQCAWLSDRGWVFELDAHGRPRVLVEYCRYKMGAAKDEPTRWQLKLA